MEPARFTNNYPGPYWDMTWQRWAYRDALDWAKKNKRTIVVCNGCFDLLHIGHLRVFQAAREVDPGNTFVVAAANDDATVKKLKGKSRPFLTLEQRLHFLYAIRFVDFAVGFWEDTPEKLLQFTEPDYLAKGEEYKGRAEDIPGYLYAKKGMLWVPMEIGCHTTDLALKIATATRKSLG